MQDVQQKENTGGLETEQVDSHLAYGSGTPPPHPHNPMYDGQVENNRMNGKGEGCKKVERPGTCEDQEEEDYGTVEQLILIQLGDTECKRLGAARGRPMEGLSEDHSLRQESHLKQIV